MRWRQPGKREGATILPTPQTPRQGARAHVGKTVGHTPGDLDRRLRSIYGAAVGTVDHPGLDRRLRVRLMGVSAELAARPRRRSWRARRTLALSLAALLLLGGSVLAVAAHVLPDAVPPPRILSQLGDHLPVGAKRPITHAQAGIWLVSLPCTPTASKRAGETTWHLHWDCPTPYKIAPQIPDSVGSQARRDVLMMIALQHYQDYWTAHPGWSAATAPRIDAQAQQAVARALNDYLDGKPVTIHYASPVHLPGGEAFAPARLREAHDVEHEREAGR